VVFLAIIRLPFYVCLVLVLLPFLILRYLGETGACTITGGPGALCATPELVSLANTASAQILVIFMTIFPIVFAAIGLIILAYDVVRLALWIRRNPSKEKT
jgi:hypothetical protein